MKKNIIEDIKYNAIPLSPDDLLQIEAISASSSIELLVEGTALNVNNQLVNFIFSCIISTSVTLTATRFRLGYKAILSAVVHTYDSSIPDGDCYARLTLVNSITGGFYPHRKLLSEGYVSTYASIGYGGSPVLGPPRVHKYLVNILVPDPAAESEWTYTVPNFTSLELFAIVFTLTTDGFGSDRYVAVQTVLSPGITQTLQFSAVTPKSSASQYNLWQETEIFTAPVQGIIMSRIPKLLLYPGTILRSATINIGGGDQYNNISLLCLRQTVPF